MAREILVHLNVVPPDDDGRTATEIAAAVEAAFKVGSDDSSVSGLEVEVVLAEEV